MMRKTGPKLEVCQVLHFRRCDGNRKSRAKMSPVQGRRNLVTFRRFGPPISRSPVRAELRGLSTDRLCFGMTVFGCCVFDRRIDLSAH